MRLSRLRRFDFYPKTIDDVSVKTFSGAAISLLSVAVILALCASELVYYLGTERHDRLRVDTTRGHRIDIHFNITFDRIPCDALNLDAVDATGEQQVAVRHNIFKTRLDEHGREIDEANIAGLGKQSDEKARKVLENLPTDYCGSCYGAEDAEVKCCNSCDEVRAAYRRQGWAFTPGEQIEQCFRESMQRRLRGEVKEGCNIHGSLSVNRVAGNFQLSPGRTMTLFHPHLSNMASPEARPELNPSHTIHSLAFGAPYPGMSNPLDGVSQKIEPGKLQLFQYFVKVVPTTYSVSGGSLLETNQYSVTQHVRHLTPQSLIQGLMPGVFFIYDLSPISVEIREEGRGFIHFLTSFLAIVGGVITVATFVDTWLYNLGKKLQRRHDL